MLPSTQGAAISPTRPSSIAISDSTMPVVAMPEPVSRPLLARIRE